MTYRARSLLTSIALLVMLGLVGATVPVPLVAIGRGPTFDTLGELNGAPVVRVSDLPTFPTSGHLNMTTVGVTTGLNAAQALGAWWAGDQQLVPRAAVVSPGETDDEAAARNGRLFRDSQNAAEVAALAYLGQPVQIVVDEVLGAGPSVDILQPGDVLVRINGRDVRNLGDLRSALSGVAPGEPVNVTVQRAGQALDLTVMSGSNPDTGDAFLGITPAVRPVRGAVAFSLGDVGGSSAGLMFALAVVDKLTPGELTGGRFVAGTGTIDSSGVVGKIEGIRFKMLAAREAGATVFLVPADNCEGAVGNVPDGLQTVRVTDLAGAVAALDQIRSGGTPPSC